MKNILEVSSNTNQRMNAIIDEYCIDCCIKDASKYILGASGKGLRPYLLNIVCDMFGKADINVLDIGCAIEFIHMYSLIHDDLPAMDNDDYRRGILTLHKKYDEATAILVGDGFNTLAFEILSNINIDPKISLKLINKLANSSGFRGMVSGQMLDIENEKPNNIEQIKKVQDYKTGKLIQGSIAMACIYSNCSEASSNILQNVSENFGLAFQIKDDILDVEGDEKIVGKKLQKDSDNFKKTFVDFIGLEEAKKYSKQLIDDSILLINELKDVCSVEAKENLICVGEYIINREK